MSSNQQFKEYNIRLKRQVKELKDINISLRKQIVFLKNALSKKTIFKRKPKKQRIMKNLKDFGILSAIMLFGVFVGFLIADDINRDDNRLNELYISVIEKTNDSLETELKELREFKKYGISIGDTTIQAVTNLKIQGKDHRVLHIDRINPGKNYFYYVLRENVAVELYVMKY